MEYNSLNFWVVSSFYLTATQEGTACAQLNAVSSSDRVWGDWGILWLESWKLGLDQSREELKPWNNTYRSSPTGDFVSQKKTSGKKKKLKRQNLCTGIIKQPNQLRFDNGNYTIFADNHIILEFSGFDPCWITDIWILFLKVYLHQLSIIMLIHIYTF